MVVAAFPKLAWMERLWARDSHSVGLGALTRPPGNRGCPSFKSPWDLSECSRTFRLSGSDVSEAASTAARCLLQGMAYRGLGVLGRCG